MLNIIKGYFKYSKEKDTAELTTESSALAHSHLERRKELKFIIKDQRQAKIYNQIWDKISELISIVDGVNFRFSDYFRDRGVIRFDTDDTLPLDAMVSVYSMTIVIRSVYKTCCNRFYPQIHLANCIYVQSTNVCDIYKKC